MKFPEPEPELVEEFEFMKASRSKIKVSLKTIETTLRQLRTELALAEIMDDTDEVKRLKAEIRNSLQEKEVVTAKLEEEEREMAEVEIQIRVKKSGKREVSHLILYATEPAGN
jgi:predicted methyltransferase